MSQALTFARPYARAVFSLARDQGRLPEWSQQLAQAACIAADARVRWLIGHPQLARDALLDLLQPEPHDPRFRDFLALLADNRRLPLLPEIAALYEQLRADAERVLKAQVRSALPLEAEEVQALREGLARRFGRRVELETVLDPELLGGAMIVAGDQVIDGSVRAKLGRLHSALTH